MIRRPPRSTRTDTLFPYTTLFRSLSLSQYRRAPVGCTSPRRYRRKNAMAAIPVRSSGARPPLHLLDTDSDLLGDLALRAEHRFPVVAAMLLAEIERAEIHDADTLPEDAITLGSEIEYLDEASDTRRTVRLVLPAAADIEAGRISVLTPMGAGRSEEPHV